MMFGSQPSQGGSGVFFELKVWCEVQFFIFVFVFFHIWKIVVFAAEEAHRVDRALVLLTGWVGLVLMAS